MKVLIVEDDKALGLFLQKGLKLEGNDTTWVEDGELALQHLRQNRPDLMVLDLGLPLRDGMEVLQELKSLSPGTAVLVLTGRSSVEERVRCLNLGADDCLLKPFSFHELTARCRAILRRQKAAEDTVLRHAGIELDLVRRQVRCEGKTLDLTTKEFALLEALLRRKGACCTREELLREVWQLDAETVTNAVDVQISYLRRKLAMVSNGTATRFSLIETVRGAGYRIPSDLGGKRNGLAFEATAMHEEVVLARGA